MADGIALFGSTALANAERHYEVVAEHDALLEVIRRRDAVGAERLARAHIRAALAAREMGMAG